MEGFHCRQGLGRWAGGRNHGRLKEFRRFPARGDGLTSDGGRSMYPIRIDRVIPVAVLMSFLAWTPATLAQNNKGAPKGKGFALLVACTDYDKKELRPLKFTRHDIQAFYQNLLEAGFPKDNIVLMHDKQAKDYLPEAKKIRKQLDLLFARLGRDDTLIVALVGHGVQFQGEKGSYFCPVDAELKDRTTLLPMEQIYEELRKCRAWRKLLLVDACRNDPLSSLAHSRAEVELESVTRPQTQQVPEGVVALFSCSAGQQSF